MMLLALQLFATSADGQRYGQPQLHTATKAVVSLAAYEAAKTLKIPKPALVSTLGVFILGKALERAKGHTLGPLDTVNDLAAHSLLVLPISTRKALPSIGLGVLWVATCKQSSPRWC